MKIVKIIRHWNELSDILDKLAEAEQKNVWLEQQIKRYQFIIKIQGKNN
jgi:predicted CoA-binding protein